MVKVSKRMKQSYGQFDREKTYSLQEAVSNIAKAPKTKFDETVELHVHLNVDPKSSDQLIRGTVVLPHGTGKKLRIIVFCKGELMQKARELGVDQVGAEDLIEKINQGFLDFDCVIATPDMMRDLSKLGKILGPRGLMPSPKAGTVTMDIERAVKEVNAGKIEFKTDKQAGIHVGIGKKSFPENHILENAQYIVEAINHAKPASVKGNLIKSLSLATTMGPGVRVTV